MERLVTELGNKIKTLDFRVAKTGAILAKQDRQALERLQSSIPSIVEAVCTLKEMIEEKKFAKSDTAETVATWNSEIQPHLEKADDSTRRIQQQIKVWTCKKKKKKRLKGTRIA